MDINWQQNGNILQKYTYREQKYYKMGLLCWLTLYIDSLYVFNMLSHPTGLKYFVLYAHPQLLILAFSVIVPTLCSWVLLLRCMTIVWIWTYPCKFASRLLTMPRTRTGPVTEPVCYNSRAFLAFNKVVNFCIGLREYPVLW